MTVERHTNSPPDPVAGDSGNGHGVGHGDGGRYEFPVDRQLVDEIEATWRRECERHVSEPGSLRFNAPVSTVAEVLNEIGLDASDTGVSLVVRLDDTTFTCADVHVAVAQLNALRRAVETTLVLSGPLLARLNELVEAEMTRVVKDCVETLCTAALLDPLTGLRNRRAFHADARGKLATSIRTGRPVAVALIDMVGLKNINDDQSHAAGDDALRRLGTVLSAHVREGDNVYRFGGDEFVLLLPGASRDDAAQILGRVDGAGCAFRWGVAHNGGDGADAESLVDAADRRMLAARRHDDGLDELAGPRLSGRQG